MNQHTYHLQSEAIEVVRVHDVRLLLRSLVLSLHQKDKAAAAAAFRSKASWHDERSILIECKSPKDAKPLRQQHCFLRKFAAKEGLDRVLLSWSGGDRPYVFAASLTPEEDNLPAIRSDKPELDALSIGEMMALSELPMGLIDLDLDDQIWANQALADLKGHSLQQCKRENVRSLWTPEGLEYIKSTLKQQGELVHRYEADLNPGEPYQLHSKFELVLDERYRLTTIYEANEVGAVVQ